MQKPTKLLLFVFVLPNCIFLFCNAIDLRPNCGFPGKPYGAKMTPEKSTFSEGDIVTYECKDYWAPPQMRRCDRGQWIGPMARCADHIMNVQTRDAQCFDLTTKSPIPVFHYTNMKLQKTDWSLPNAFVAKAFKGGQLLVKDDHEYSWQFNLTEPAIKLYVKVNFLFLNFTGLPEAEQNAHRFAIEADISPYRSCIMEYQSSNPWLVTGNRIDTYFRCEARSVADAKEEQKYIPNYLTVKTRSSHSIPHLFSALFFGKVYGTEASPICGEPEVFVGEITKTNREYKDYVIECGNPNYWVEGMPTGRIKGIPQIQRCLSDMIWNGTRPLCLPIKHCPLTGPVFDKLKQEIASRNESTDYNDEIAPRKDVANKTKNGVKTPRLNPAPVKQQPLSVDSFVNYFHTMDGKAYAIHDSEITYSCDSSDFILMGKVSRKCRDGKWIGTEPTCKNISSKQLIFVILGLVVLLLFLLIISGFIFYQHNKRMKSRVKQAELDVANATSAANEHNILNKLNYNDDGIYELYDRVDEPGACNEYTGTNYNPCNPLADAQYYDHLMGKDPRDEESDYLQMYRKTDKSYEPLVKPLERLPPRVKSPLSLPISGQQEEEESEYLDLSGGLIKR